MSRFNEKMKSFFNRSKPEVRPGEPVGSELDIALYHMRRTPRPTDKDDFRDEVYRAREIILLNGMSALPRLITILTDETENPGYRSRVAEILGIIHNERAIGPLIQTLKDPNIVLRWNTIKALEEIGDCRATPELEKVASSDTGEFSISTKGPMIKIRDEALKAIDSIKQRNIR